MSRGCHQPVRPDKFHTKIVHYMFGEFRSFRDTFRDGECNTWSWYHNWLILIPKFRNYEPLRNSSNDTMRLTPLLTQLNKISGKKNFWSNFSHRFCSVEWVNKISDIGLGWLRIPALYWRQIFTTICNAMDTIVFVLHPVFSK